MYSLFLQDIIRIGIFCITFVLHTRRFFVDIVKYVMKYEKIQVAQRSADNNKKYSISQRCYTICGKRNSGKRLYFYLICGRSSSGCTGKFARGRKAIICFTYTSYLAAKRAAFFISHRDSLGPSAIQCPRSMLLDSGASYPVEAPVPTTEQSGSDKLQTPFKRLPRRPRVPGRPFYAPVKWGSGGGGVGHRRCP